MIQLQYHTELLEQAVRLAARREAATENELHRAIDPIYELPPGPEREARFRATFTTWFAHLKLDRWVDELLSCFSQVVERVEAGLVRSAPRRKAEGAELYMSRDESAEARRTLVIQICPESLVEGGSVRDTMIRELQHVEDMVDDCFGYEPDALDGLPARMRIVLDRYRVLWEMRVESTLSRRGILSRSNESGLRGRFLRVFTVGGTAPPVGLFDLLWSERGTSHEVLLSRARNPRSWLKQFRAPGQEGPPAMAGEPCPSCGFPTFDWYDGTKTEHERLARHLVASRADAREGVCRQCAEWYLSAAGTSSGSVCEGR